MEARWSERQEEAIEDPTADEGVYVNTACWTLAAVSGLFLLLRAYSKWHARRRLWWDDILIIAAWLCLAASNVSLSVAVTQGFGKHIAVLEKEARSAVGYTWEWTGTFGILAVTASKTSFAVTLLRVMDGSRPMRLCLWVVIITMNVAMMLNVIFGWVRCTPVARGWNMDIPGTCWPPGVYAQYSMFTGGYSAAMDFVLAAMPWRIVWSLKMRTREKVGVAVALSLGIFAGATAVVKTAMIPTLGGEDFTYDGVRLAVWTAAEPAVTVMATTIPVLRSLVIEFKEKTKRTAATDEWTHRKTRTGHSTVTVTADRTRFENDSNESGHRKGDEGVLSPADKVALSMLAAAGGDKILQTREVAIEFEDRIDTESVEYVELCPQTSQTSTGPGLAPWPANFSTQG